MNTSFKYFITNIFTAFWLCMASTALHAAPLTVLTYHDIVADPGDNLYAISRSMFIAHMDYLQTHGYQPISLTQLQQYRDNPQAMPAKAVMLTFDDGLKSYHDFVVPVLKIYGFPSINSVVTAWMDGKDLPPEYRGKLMNWDQLRELIRSPLVEVVSHTHDLHHGIQSNPQGSMEAASVTRQYFPLNQQYETEEAYRRRVKQDLRNSMERIKAELGYSPRAVTWPYGMYDNVLSKVASELGLEYQFSLKDGPTKLAQLPRINRIMLLRSDNIGDFINDITYQSLATRQKRFTLINLDAFSQAKSIDEQEQMLSRLLDQLQPLQLNMVVISPFSADNRQAFFPNPEIPLGADVLRRVTHTLRSKLNIRQIYMHLPAELPVKNLSPVYGELARLLRFDGVVFDAEIEEKKAGFIQALLSDVHKDLYFGYLGLENSHKAADFIIAPFNTDASLAANRIEAAKLKGIPTAVYLLSDKPQDINNLSLSAARQHFQALDIQHYGFQIDTTSLASVLRSNNPEHATGSAAPAGG